jgi:hypothetical protein
LHEHPDLLLGQAEGRGQVAPQPVRRLVRTPDGQLVVAVGPDQDGPRFDGGVGEPLLAVPRLDHDGRVTPYRLIDRCAELLLERHIGLSIVEAHATGGGLSRIQQGRQGIDVYVCGVPAVLGGVPVGGKHHCDRLAEVAHPIGG